MSAKHKTADISGSLTNSVLIGDFRGRHTHVTRDNALYVISTNVPLMTYSTVL